MGWSATYLYLCFCVFLYLCICVFVYEICTVQTMMVTMGAWDGFGHGANGGLRYMRAWQNGSFLGMCAISRNTQGTSGSGSGQISNICQCLIELSREGGWNKSIRASTERATVRAASRYGVVGQGLTEGHLTGHKSHMAQNKMIHNAPWIMYSHHLSA